MRESFCPAAASHARLVLSKTVLFSAQACTVHSKKSFYKDSGRSFYIALTSYCILAGRRNKEKHANGDLVNVFLERTVHLLFTRVFIYTAAQHFPFINLQGKAGFIWFPRRQSLCRFLNRSPVWNTMRRGDRDKAVWPF